MLVTLNTVWVIGKISKKLKKKRKEIQIRKEIWKHPDHISGITFDNQKSFIELLSLRFQWKIIN